MGRGPAQDDCPSALIRAGDIVSQGCQGCTLDKATKAGSEYTFVPTLLSLANWLADQVLTCGGKGYHNLRILLFGSLLIRSSVSERASIPGCVQAVRKCLDSAKQTISIIYQTYEHNDFFRTW